MSTKGQLSFWDCRHIEEILSDPSLLSVLIVDGEKGRHITVGVDGKITVGRTRYAWLNSLFRDTKTIDFELFAFKVANAFAGQAKNRNEFLFHAISEVVLKKAIADNDFHYVADALYHTLLFGWEGEHRSSFVPVDMKDELPSYNTRPLAENIGHAHGEVRLNSGEVFCPKVVVEYKLRK